MSLTAICLSGMIRFPEKALKSINNINCLNKKIFIHTWNTIDNKCLNEFKYESCIIENYKDKEKEFNQLYNNFISRTITDETWIGEQRQDVGICSMYYSINKSNLLKCQYEKIHNIIFDKVIRMRFDSDFQDKILNIDQFNDDLFIPTGCDWCDGINDQFAIGPSKIMDIYSNVYLNMLNLNCKYHPERILLSHLKMNQINPKRFIFDITINNSSIYHREVQTKL